MSSDGQPSPEGAPRSAGAPPQNGRSATGLADGEWHRLHPATPLLRGGIVLIAILGFVIANLRERVVEIFIDIFAPDLPVPGEQEYREWESGWANDPIGGLVLSGALGWALLVTAVVLIVLIVGFWLSWRLHSFRITDEAVEVRSGILFRSHRSARLDRIQGINISRPLVPRLLGAAKLEVAVAGQSANVQLSYLSSSLADGLRGDVLRLASGARGETPGRPQGMVPGAEARAPQGAVNGARDFLAARVDEMLAPELDPSLAAPESVVHIPPGRVVGSALLSGASVAVLLAVAAVIWGLTARQFWVIFVFVPAMIGFASYYWSRVTKSLRYSIAGTADGVRVGHGLLSTSNDTIPPGRIHAIQVQQSILWRPFGWWMVRINTAGQSLSQSGQQQGRTIVLPVGMLTDVKRVLALLMPAFDLDRLDAYVETGMLSKGGDELFSRAPRRAAWLKPFSWRRTGYAIEGGVVLLRDGVILRDLKLVPLARMQSVAVQQGPVKRLLRLAEARVHTVAGPVAPLLPVIARDDAVVFFESVSAAAVEWSGHEPSERWAAPLAAPPSVSVPVESAPPDGHSRPERALSPGDRAAERPGDTHG